MKDENEKTPRNRRSQKVFSQENNPTNLTEEGLREPRTAQSGEPNFPDEWIAIAAYYIWKSEGEPQGREADHWERAKADIRQLQQEGILPVAREGQ